MLYFNIAMLGIAIYFVCMIFTINKIVKDGPNDTKITVIKIDAARKPGLIQAFLFGLLAVIIYWVFV